MSASAATPFTFSRCIGARIRLPLQELGPVAAVAGDLVTGEDEARDLRAPVAGPRRGSARRGSCRSEWTPTESPWTLPTGLFAEVHSFGRPGSRRTSWLAASESASPMASASIPSASAAATASAACVRGRTRRSCSANFSTHASSAALRAGLRAHQLVLVEQLRKQFAKRLVVLRVVRVLLGLHAVVDRLAEHRVGPLGADEVDHVPRPRHEHDAVDLGRVVDLDEQLVEGIDRACRSRRWPRRSPRPRPCRPCGRRRGVARPRGGSESSLPGFDRLQAPRPSCRRLPGAARCCGRSTFMTASGLPLGLRSPPSPSCRRGRGP